MACFVRNGARLKTRLNYELSPKTFLMNNSRMLTVGESAEERRTLTAKDVKIFAEVSGDFNPIHLDETVARKTRFGKCIVHGALLNGIISALLGLKVPGPGSILVNQYLEYTAPLFVGEEVLAKVEVTSVKRSIVECVYSCKATSRNEIVMKGYAKLLFVNLTVAQDDRDDKQKSTL